MSVTVRFSVADPAADIVTYGAGALLYCYAGATQGGAYTLYATVLLNAAVSTYAVWDPTGTAATWHKSRRGNAAGDSFSAYSTAAQTALWAPDYATTAELKTYLRVGSGDTVDDALLTGPITAASRAIDAATDRQFGLVAAQTRYYTAHLRRDGRYVVPIDDLMDSTGLAVTHDADLDGTYETTITGSTLLPRNAAALGMPWEALLLPTSTAVLSDEGAMAVLAPWGWTTIPDTIVQATLLQASRVVKRRDAPFGVAGSVEFGSELRLLAKLDPDVEVMVAPYRRYDFSAV